VSVDPVDLGILWDRLVAVTDEILTAIVRTAFSVGVREAWDLACVLFDKDGRSIAQATLSMPAFIGTAPFTMKHMLARFPADTLRPGDVLVTNDAWKGTGHTPDICVARPVFHEGRLQGFVMTITHLPDIGGNGLKIENTEIYQEGLMLPPCRLYRAGEANQELLELIRLNVRTPDQVMGDIMANVGGTAVGERLLLELMEEYRLDDLAPLAEAIVDGSERTIRSRIADIPDGTWRNAIEVEAVEGTVRLACAVTVRGDSVHLDFAGTGPVARHAINVPLCYTRAFAAYTIKCLTAPALPNNEGAVLPIAIDVPEGCILDARRPAATGGRHTVGWFIVPLIMGAMADAVPGRVQADSGMASLILVNGTHPDGREVVTQYFLAGGLGAMDGLDGHQTTPFPTNNAVVPTEIFENETGVHIRHRRLLPDSGGPGRHRGGLGQEAEIVNASGHDLAVSIFGMRTLKPARGLHGGRPGVARSFAINGGPIPAKGRHVLAPGDVLTIREAGGGGFGDPRERHREAVLRDLAAGFVTPESARADYGVDVRSGGRG
jgi:N-methylhydantoinase B